MNNPNNLRGNYTLFQPYYISVEIRYRNNRLKSRLFIWCDNYARGILRCHLARGGTLFFMMKEEKICSFFGHRSIELTDALCAALRAEILRAIDFGCRVFYFGGYGEFDALCHQIVTEIREKHPDYGIRRIYCVPQERDLRRVSGYFGREDYEEIVYLMPSFDGWYKSIYFRNCAMIDESDRIIFYVEKRQRSGAYKAYEYAKAKKKQIVNLW